MTKLLNSTSLCVINLNCDKNFLDITLGNDNFLRKLCYCVKGRSMQLSEMIFTLCCEIRNNMFYHDIFIVKYSTVSFILSLYQNKSLRSNVVSRCETN